MHIVHLQGAVKGGELLSLDEPMMIEVFFFNCGYIHIQLHIYTSTAKGAPLCFWKLISLRGPTTGTLIPKVGHTNC